MVKDTTQPQPFQYPDQCCKHSKQQKVLPSVYSASWRAAVSRIRNCPGRITFGCPWVSVYPFAARDCLLLIVILPCAADAYALLRDPHGLLAAHRASVGGHLWL